MWTWIITAIVLSPVVLALLLIAMDDGITADRIIRWMHSRLHD